MTRRAARTLLTVLLLFTTTVSLAQETRFDIAAQPLEAALAEFGSQSGLQVTADAEVTAGVQANAVDGQYTPETALQRLLDGTGVTYRFADDETVALVAAGDSGSEQLEAIRVQAQGERAGGPVEGYKANRTGTATRTDTPIQDVPASIQVISRDVMDDQNAQDVREAVRNVSGVFVDNSFGGIGRDFNIRGFEQRFKLRNGFRGQEKGELRSQELANVERVEVLKGPASITSGRLGPGGIVNIVTERPTAEPRGRLELESGTTSEGGPLFQPSVDVSGPVTDDGTVQYRLNALYSARDSYREPFNQDFERTFFAPVVSFDLGADTDLRVELEYTDDERPFDRGVPFFEGQFADRDRNLQSANDFAEVESTIASYTLEHDFTDDLRLRHRSTLADLERFNLENQPFAPATDFPGSFPNAERGDFARFIGGNESDQTTFSTQTELLTSIDGPLAEHEALLAFDFTRGEEERAFRQPDASAAFPTFQGEKNKINIFDPVDKVPAPTRQDLTYTDVEVENITEEFGVLLQDQMTFSDQWEVLVGGRFSWVDQERETEVLEEKAVDNEADQEDDAVFSPRLGVVHKPIKPVSLYASYSESFEPTESRDKQGDFLDPVEGEQFEVGVKSEFLDRRLRTTLAAFEITKTNIPQSRSGPGGSFNVPIGEERSRGIELDVTGRITGGWTVIGSYAFIDSEITDNPDDQSLEGNELAGVPEHSASLWSNYEVQTGQFRGLKWGAGIFYRGERQANTENSFELPSYTRVDARVGYQQDDWEVNLTLKNLFDTEDNFEAVDTGPLVQPGTPLTAIASMSVKF